MTWASFLAGLFGFLSKLMSALPAFLAYMAGKRAGIDSADSDSLSEQQKRVLIAKRAAEEAERNDTPDPYLRD